MKYHERTGSLDRTVCRRRFGEGQWVNISTQEKHKNGINDV